MQTRKTFFLLPNYIEAFLRLLCSVSILFYSFVFLFSYSVLTAYIYYFKASILCRQSSHYCICDFCGSCVVSSQGLQCVLSTVGIPSSVLLEAVITVTETTKEKSESSVKKILMNWPFL